jgi:pimeloyl-ACP methyl ester carboxylesterase
MAKPILLVLAHGIFGWGESADRGNQMKDYYFGVRPFLEKEYGSRIDGIIAPTVKAAESVEVRGNELATAIRNQLTTMPADTKVHILAHSMGGLDARWVIAEGMGLKPTDRMADHIASLTTIATPHRGTTLGNIAFDLRVPIRWIGDILEHLTARKEALLDVLQEHLGLRERNLSTDHLEFYHHLLRNVVLHSTPKDTERGLHALTLGGANEFNARHAQAELTVRNRRKNRIVYVSYGGVMKKDSVPLLKPSHDIMEWFATPPELADGNDGAVSVWSAHFPWDGTGQNYVETLPYDHFAQINWRIPDSRPGDSMQPDLQAVYRKMIERILAVDAS